MAVKNKDFKDTVICSSQLMISLKDKPKVAMYRSMYAELNYICKKYGALVDLTVPGEISLVNTTGNCRRKIRAVYGVEATVFREGKRVELGGFL